MPVPSGLTDNGDNTQVLQAAMANGGFSLPQGIFPISRALVPSLACTLEASSSYRSVLQQTSPGQSAIAMVDGARLTIEGMGFTGPGSADGIAPGISITRNLNPNTFGLLMNEVVIQQFGGNGIDAPEGNLIVSSLTRVTCESLGGIGFNLTGVPGGSAGTSLSLDACYAAACKKAGYVLDKMCYSSLRACACDSSGAGYIFTGCQGIDVTACGTEGVVATGTDMYSDGTNFRADNCNGVDFGNACWTYANSHYVLHVSGESTNIRAARIGENSPLATALGHTLVDSGSQFG